MKNSMIAVLKRISISLVLLFGLVMPVYAVVMTVTSSDNEGEGVKHSVYISSWVFNDPTRTICGGEQNWRAYACEPKFYAVSNSGAIYPGREWRLEASQTVITLGMMLDLLRRQQMYIPYTGSIWTPKNFDTKCISFGYSSLYVPTQSKTPNMAITPCIPVKATPLQCDISGNTTIDHQTLSEDVLNGAQASTQLNIKCNGAGNITVRATRTNSYGVSLRSDSSLYSEIKVNGSDATNGIYMTIRNNVSTPINISSTLKTRGAVAPGPFSGSTVITVSPY